MSNSPWFSETDQAGRLIELRKPAEQEVALVQAQIAAAVSLHTGVTVAADDVDMDPTDTAEAAWFIADAKTRAEATVCATRVSLAQALQYLDLPARNRAVAAHQGSVRVLEKHLEAARGTREGTVAPLCAGCVSQLPDHILELSAAKARKQAELVQVTDLFETVVLVGPASPSAAAH